MEQNLHNISRAYFFGNKNIIEIDGKCQNEYCIRNILIFDVPTSHICRRCTNLICSFCSNKNHDKCIRCENNIHQVCENCMGIKYMSMCHICECIYHICIKCLNNTKLYISAKPSNCTCERCKEFRFDN